MQRAPLCVRGACAADLPAVLRIQAACHAAELLESAACVGSILSAGASFVACDAASGAVVGYALAHGGAQAALGAVLPAGAAGVDDDGCAFLHDVAVEPAARGAGAARALVDAVLAHAARAGAKSAHLVALPGTRALWERLGFAACADGEFADAASYGAGATHMRRSRLADAAR